MTAQFLLFCENKSKVDNNLRELDARGISSVQGVIGQTQPNTTHNSRNQHGHEDMCLGP